MADGPSRLTSLQISSLLPKISVAFALITLTKYIKININIYSPILMFRDI
jgi:hypothetical protein